jgi:hypothetical protein
MSLGGSFLKPAVAPLNFANVSLMGRIITSGLRELAAENLMNQLKLGVKGAAEAAGVRVADIEKLLPIARFQELASKLDGDQKIAVHAWRDQPVESRRAADLAKLTEAGKLPVLADSLMRLSVMAGDNRELRESLANMATIMREWQELVLATGNKLDDDRALSDAYKRRALRRALLVALLVPAIGVAIWMWQRVQQARYRINAQIGSADPCAVLTIEAKDLERATPEQNKQIAGRKTECEAKREKEAAEKAEREKKAEYERQCSELATAIKQGKTVTSAAAIPPKLLAFANRVAKGELDGTDIGPKDPTFPCADTEHLASLQASFDRTVVTRSTRWLETDDLSPRVKTALEKLVDQVPADLKKDLEESAEKEAVAALVDRSPAHRAKAKRLCVLKATFKLPLKQFCRVVTE